MWDLRTVSLDQWGDPYKEPDRYLYSFRKWIGDMNTQYIKTMTALQEKNKKEEC
jgi:hypothetical protein